MRSQGYANAKDRCKCIGLLVLFGILIAVGSLIVLFQLLLLAGASCCKLIAEASWFNYTGQERRHVSSVPSRIGYIDSEVVSSFVCLNRAKNSS